MTNPSYPIKHPAVQWHCAAVILLLDGIVQYLGYSQMKNPVPVGFPQIVEVWFPSNFAGCDLIPLSSFDGSVPCPLERLPESAGSKWGTALCDYGFNMLKPINSLHTSNHNLGGIIILKLKSSHQINHMLTIELLSFSSKLRLNLSAKPLTNHAKSSWCSWFYPNKSFKILKNHPKILINHPTSSKIIQKSTKIIINQPYHPWTAPDPMVSAPRHHGPAPPPGSSPGARRVGCRGLEKNCGNARGGWQVLHIYR